MELASVLKGAETLLKMPLSYDDITDSIQTVERLREALRRLEREQRMRPHTVHATVEVRIRLETHARSEDEAKEELQSFFHQHVFETTNRDLEIMDEEVQWHSIEVEAEDLDEDPEYE